MTPEVIPNPYVLAVITGVLAVLGSSIAAYFVFKAQIKRIGSQNGLDDVNTAKIALEISEKSLAKQKEQESEIQSLKNILKNRHYRATINFTLGETPQVISATIEAVEIKKVAQISH